MRKLLALSAIALVVAGIASADQCRTVNGVTHHNATTTVVTAPAIVTTAAVLPVYGAAYQQTAAGDDETKALLRELLAEMRAMRADLANAGGQAQALKAPGGIDAVALLKTSCAKCHTGEKSKGDFLIYTDKGESVKLSPADRREMTKRIASGNMPPPPTKLSTAEKDALAKGLK